MNITNDIYGPGGLDPVKPNNNVIATTATTTAPEQDNADDIRTTARQALAANRAFVASTPTAAQTTAQVRALSRQVNNVIRLLLNQLDATD